MLRHWSTFGDGTPAGYLSAMLTTAVTSYRFGWSQGTRWMSETSAWAQNRQLPAGERKVLIGGGVTTGLVGVVAAWYLVGTPNEVEAVCTDDSATVVADNNCDETYLTSHGGYYNSGTGFWILPIGGGYRQYRYNYGGS